jgi:hypothetical protein
MALPGYAAAFAMVLLVLSLGHGQFQAIHRSLMAFCIAPLGYMVATFLFNRTMLARHDDELSVTHGPLPWRRRVSLPIGEVKVLRYEPQNARVVLRTQRGEEVTLLDDMKHGLAKSLDAPLQRLLAPQESLSETSPEEEA